MPRWLVRLNPEIDAMGYFVLVIAQTIVLPLVCGTWQLADSGGDAVLV